MAGIGALFIAASFACITIWVILTMLWFVANGARIIIRFYGDEDDHHDGDDEDNDDEYDKNIDNEMNHMQVHVRQPDSPTSYDAIFADRRGRVRVQTKRPYAEET
jgi:hypothetical protein